MKTKLSQSLLTVSLPLVITSTAYAQNQDLGISVVVADNLVANQAASLKSDTSIIDVPQSLSIFTAQRIQEQGIISIADIVDYTPGVNTSQGEGHRDSIVFRGVRSTADFYVNGVRDDVQYYRSLYNVEQVEILRGPNALFFGRGGTGGVLNRVQKMASFDGAFSSYHATVDSEGETTIQFDTNYVLSDKAALRLNLHHDSLNNHRDHYNGNRIGLNPTFAYKLGDKTTLNLSYEHIDHQRFIDRGIPTGTNGRPVVALKDIVFGDSELNTTEVEAYVFRANVEHEFNDTFRASFNASYQNFDKLYQNLYASGYDRALTPNLVTLDGYRDTTERQTLNLSANFIKELETGKIDHKFTFGFDLNETSSDNLRFDTDWNPDPAIDQDKETFTLAQLGALRNGVGTNSAGVPVANTFGTDLNRSTEVDVSTYSIYLQDEIAITDNLDIVAGIRLDKIETDFRNVISGARASQSDTEVSPRAGIVFKPNENASIYASYSKSFLPSSGEQFKNLGDQLDPDTFTNLEVGVKWNFNDNLAFTASVFEIDQTATEDNGGGLQIEVDSEISGFELQLEGKINDFWHISAGYSHLDGETSTGARPRELPETAISVWNQFEVTDKFGFGLGVIYQDESLISSGGAQTLPSYTRIDASAYYKISEDLRLQLNLENLADKTYFPNSHSTHQASVGAPFTVRLSVTGKF